MNLFLRQFLVPNPIPFQLYITLCPLKDYEMGHWGSSSIPKESDSSLLLKLIISLCESNPLVQNG